MKRIQALVASAIITGLVAIGMLLIGINALFNASSVPPSNSRVNAVVSTAGSTTGSTDNAQVAELQNQIAQYQAQLNQANAQLQQYQQILSALQARGIIRITNDGQIQLGRGGFGGDGD